MDDDEQVEVYIPPAPAVSIPTFTTCLVFYISTWLPGSVCTVSQDLFILLKENQALPCCQPDGSWHEVRLISKDLRCLNILHYSSSPT